LEEHKVETANSNLINPCLTCGACCAFYRVSFYWRERDDSQPEGVPEEWREDLNAFRCVMKGTNQSNPRCIALSGTIGKQVFCEIYERRPSVCRELEPSYKNGHPEPKCDRARSAYGLAPLTPDTWTEGKGNDDSPPHPYSPAA